MIQIQKIEALWCASLAFTVKQTKSVAELQGFLCLYICCWSESSEQRERCTPTNHAGVVRHVCWFSSPYTIEFIICLFWLQVWKETHVFCHHTISHKSGSLPRYQIYTACLRRRRPCCSAVSHQPPCARLWFALSSLGLFSDPVLATAGSNICSVWRAYLFTFTYNRLQWECLDLGTNMVAQQDAITQRFSSSARGQTCCCVSACKKTFQIGVEPIWNGSTLLVIVHPSIISLAGDTLQTHTHTIQSLIYN